MSLRRSSASLTRPRSLRDYNSFRLQELLRVLLRDYESFTGRLWEFYWEITRVLLKDYKSLLRDYKSFTERMSYKTCDRKKHVCLGVSSNKFYSRKRVLRLRSNHKVVNSLLTSLLSFTEFTLHQGFTEYWMVCKVYCYLTVSLYSVQRYVYIPSSWM